MKYTYLLDNKKIKEELEYLYQRYESFLTDAGKIWHQLNEARAILYLTGQIYCEQIAVEAIKNRLHLLKNPLSIQEFFYLIDSHSEKLKELRKDKLFCKLEEFYNIIKKYKNKYSEGKFYLNEEKFIELYNAFTFNKEMRIGYKGNFDEKNLKFMS